MTNASVSDPFTVCDASDWRRVSENGIFNEGTDPWHLVRFSQRPETAVVVRCHWTQLVMGASRLSLLASPQDAGSHGADTSMGTCARRSVAGKGEHAGGNACAKNTATHASSSLARPLACSTSPNVLS